MVDTYRGTRIQDVEFSFFLGGLPNQKEDTQTVVCSSVLSSLACWRRKHRSFLTE